MKADYLNMTVLMSVRSRCIVPHGCVIDPAAIPDSADGALDLGGNLQALDARGERHQLYRDAGASVSGHLVYAALLDGRTACAPCRCSYLHYRVDRVESSVKSDNKVFEVCGEFACALEFCRADPARSAAFLCDLFGQQFSTYRWNYDRIFAAHHLEFAERWANEFRIPFENGELDESRFEPGDWALMLELLRDPAAFAVSRG